MIIVINCLTALRFNLIIDNSYHFNSEGQDHEPLFSAFLSA